MVRTAKDSARPAEKSSAREAVAHIEIDGTVSGDQALIELLEETIQHIKDNKKQVTAGRNQDRKVVFEKLQGSGSLVMSHRC